jgi:hypothetical protein
MWTQRPQNLIVKKSETILETQRLTLRIQLGIQEDFRVKTMIAKYGFGV